MKAFRFIHKWLGMLMAPLMVMWFISGYFMIFSGFPRVENKSKLMISDHFSTEDSVPPLALLSSLYAENTKSDAQLTGVELSKSREILFFTLLGSEGPIVIDAESNRIAESVKPKRADIEDMTVRITGQMPQKIDTLTNLEQWVPFSSRRADLPIYKVYVRDGKGTHLYFSGQNGQLLQQTNKDNRLLAYFGAIPHWLYFWPIRQNADLWKNMFVILGILGCIMTISGIIMGIYRTVQIRKKGTRKWSPYKKNGWFYWHHIIGLIFGIIVLTWIFSGWMSLDQLPTWMTGPSPRKEIYTLSKSSPIENGEAVDFEALIKNYPMAKRITYANYMGVPYYFVEDETGGQYVSLSSGKADTFSVSEHEVLSFLSEHSSGIEVTGIKKLTDYNARYLPHPAGKRKPPLPVFEVTTEEGTMLHIAIAEPKIQVSNKATVLNSWAYSKLHAFKFLWAYRHPALWMTVMLVLLTGGAIVSITGLVLGWGVLKRLFCRKKRRTA